jgi:CHAD domain-containing protein
MRDDAWPAYCRDILAACVASAARQFPPKGETEAEQIHSLRKSLKEARAIARLFLRCVGEPARVTIASLAVVRRRVGRARDLDVMEMRLLRLSPPAEIGKPLAAAIARERDDVVRLRGGLAAGASRTQLNAIVKRVEAWDLREAGTTDIVDAVARTYRQARQRGRLAFANDDPAALHALRSRVVDLCYQLAALSPAWPAALEAQSEELDALRDTLGAFNDLVLLSKFAADRGGLEPYALVDLQQRLDTKREKLGRRAKIEFKRLFAETPGAFADRLSAYLEHPIKKPKICDAGRLSRQRTAAGLTPPKSET